MRLNLIGKVKRIEITMDTTVGSEKHDFSRVYLPENYFH